MELNPIKIVADLQELLVISNNKDIVSEIVPGLAILVMYMWLSLVSLKKVLEVLASIVDSLGKLGLPLRNNQDQKLAIRRRQQFCAVLRSDLDAIAKAENWNDQWFTDLEAEVEAEGGYYSNILARMLRHRSNGIRRVPSLIQAIQSSTERCMLLVGDPGCGKSVALRHLGRTLADEVSKSKAVDAKVPLYINLKELPACNAEELTPDYIEKFVIEHIRRGDSDTAAYVREHWQDYKRKGTWFFLFDSFDEIPAVLHAPNGSKTIELHSQALRKFMDGMGACRGVLASREYKGPEALPWQKLRILQLNQQRQDELIDNTYLSNPHKTLVRQHLATIGSSIFGNPLFMSLLCRFVGDTQKCPANDYDLLLRHIERLANRDPEYIKNRYGLNEQQLLEGATSLAVLFAEEPKLSLAPKHDEIAHALKVRQELLSVDLERLLSALIDVKIGRSDVKEARPGDRRFTFSHRRYQETLFVQYLALHPQHISTENLLLDSRWREFTVTLIQSQPEDIFKRFADEAALQIDVLPQTFIAIPIELGEGLNFFDWSSGSLLHLLQLVNEGFSKRLDLVPDSLREAISRQLLPRWEGGDLYDKLMVVRYGCLLPAKKYQEILEWAIRSGIDLFLQASFMNAQFLTVLPDSMGKWIRKQFADKTFVSDSKIELLKLDALGNILPKNLSAPLIFARCKMLRSILYQPWPIRLVFLSLKEIGQLGDIVRSMLTGKRQRETYDMALNVTIVWLYVAIFPIAIIFNMYLSELPINPALIASAGVSSVFVSTLLLRSEPHALTPFYLMSILSKSLLSVFNSFKLIITIIVACCFIYVLILLPREWFYLLKLLIAILFIIAFIAGISRFITNQVRSHNMVKRLRQMMLSEDSVWRKIRQANSAEELLVWLEKKPEIWLVDLATTRSILCYLEYNFCDAKDAGATNLPAPPKGIIKELAKFLLPKLGY